MSVSQFTPVLRESILKIYADSSNKVDLASFGKLSRKQLFKVAPETTQLRAKFESKDYHTSSITLEGLTALNKQLINSIEDLGTKKLVENFLGDPNFFYNFLGYLEQQTQVLGYGSTDYRLENVPQDTLKTIFTTYLQENLTQVPKPVVAALGKNIESGHLAGVFFLKLKTALGVRTQFQSSAQETYRDFTVTLDDVTDPKAVELLDTVLKAVLDADYLTSNLLTNSQVFIDATKSVLGDKPTLVTELQFKLDNQQAGRVLQQTGTQLNRLIQAASRSEMGSTEQAIVKLIQSLKPVADLILQKAEELREPLESQGIYDAIVKNAQRLTETLVNTPGSVTLKDGIGQSLANVIKTGKVLPSSATKIKPRPIRQQHREILNITQVAQEFSKAVQQVKAAVNKTKTPKTVRVQKPQVQVPVNLTSLLRFFNQHIQNVVSANMGDGSRLDILNYRTGRFAESVKVERLTQDRAGTLTAYYSYMRDPYATFSAGGRQQYPRSRDPKLLISNSIREIAQQRAITRLRTVLV